MKPPGIWSNQSSSRRRKKILGLGAALLLTASIACASKPLPLPELDSIPLSTERNVRVRLHFGEEADLDLHVTGPNFETVYFGNNPSKHGGWLEEDLRCNATAPRIEVITIPDAKPGRYRVGVDFVEACRSISGPVPFGIEVDARDLHLEDRGEIAPGHFHAIALEFDVE